MAKKKESQKEFSTCLENAPFAEVMQRMLGQKGVGSLCAEMMKKIRERQGKGCNFSCSEMMLSMMKGCGGIKEESPKTTEEEDHVRKE